jgi:hypothetical protein
MPTRDIILLVGSLFLGGLLLLIFLGSGDGGLSLQYKRINTGMTLTEVESLFGRPGMEVQRGALAHMVVPKPGVVVPPDPPSGPYPTARTYPTELRPFVQGDRFFRWEVAGEYVLVGFKNGLVHDKYYWRPSL